MTLDGPGRRRWARSSSSTATTPPATAAAGRPVKTYTPSDYGFSNTVTGPFGNADSFLELELPYTDLGVSGGQCGVLVLHLLPGRPPLTSPKDSIFGDEKQDYDAASSTISTPAPLPPCR